MTDSTESVRRDMIESGQVIVDMLKAPQRWDTDELRRDFTVVGFLAPFVVVVRKADGVKGSMEFSHNPRYYFNFMPD